MLLPRMLQRVIQQAEPEDIALIAKMGGTLKSTDPDLESMTLGQRLLVGERWKGVIECGNELSMMRFNTYTERESALTTQYARGS